MTKVSTRRKDDRRPDDPASDATTWGLGPALRRAWVGYQRRLDEAMVQAGFDDRRLPDGRVLRLCSEPGGATIVSIGRHLDMTRQGAGKVVTGLRDRGYVSIADSPTSGREKSVTLTPLGGSYLEARRKAARAIERELRHRLGETDFDGLLRLLDALGEGQDARMRTYLRRSRPDGAGPRRPSATPIGG